ncbi:FAD-binding domain-containing protein [Lindgomyces ingoldianus]|uniref:FAD-binding domain-containing protein n=1 Tax=Lindgomyces ingoldianus TaxID=673940 RepID=A0ACB6QAZ7_9PLEO|nr:FAD-binding domain-containing protein [Lindgomyces ingoldianus]KAF2463763.1 FAD-binding domain-containing protein [Lindgomyces ingoldianus]
MSILTLLFSALVFPLHGSSASGSHCCTKLRSTFGNYVLFPDSLEYNTSVSSYFYMEQRTSPSCIIAPRDVEEVAAVLRSLQSCKDVEVAVRSGGHSPNQFFSNAKNGVTIDLRGLNSIVPKEDENIVAVGTGARWRDVYSILDPLGRTVVGARVASVGVGGFLSGGNELTITRGGISFFSPSEGFGCDNVRNMQVVLANGTVVDANSRSNPTLFRALKGGQNNFGIITRFDLKLKKVSKFWGGAILSPGAADPAQLDAFTTFKLGIYDPLLEIEQTFVYYGSQNSSFSSNNLFYLNDGTNTSALDRFTQIRPQITLTKALAKICTLGKKSFSMVCERGMTISTMDLHIADSPTNAQHLA